ncbi:MAG TPA: hypothetical protein VGD69_05680 [Herpetosiphonaceae bacterium]
MWRHGDVLIAAISKMPADAKPRPGTILAYGEITGHSHRLQNPESAELWEAGGRLFLRILSESATVVHEEHKPITLPRGTYRVWMQREYTPAEIRTVVD